MWGRRKLGRGCGIGLRRGFSESWGEWRFGLCCFFFLDSFESLDGMYDFGVANLVKYGAIIFVILSGTHDDGLRRDGKLQMSRVHRFTPHFLRLELRAHAARANFHSYESDVSWSYVPDRDAERHSGHVCRWRVGMGIYVDYCLGRVCDVSHRGSWDDMKGESGVPPFI